VLALLTVAYFVAGKLGLMLAFVNASATAVWAPTGIALAALVVLGYRVWPAIFVGAFLVNATTAGTPVTSLCIATGNTLEGLVGAYLVNRFARGRLAFERTQDIFAFAILAGVVSTGLSATIGVTSLAATGFAAWDHYGPVWLTWWLGDLGGDLVVAPVLFLWSASPRLRWSRRQAVEAGLMLASLLVVGGAVFGGTIPLAFQGYPLAPCIPFFAWAAFRFGQRETATATFVLAALAVWGTLHGVGPFAREAPNESLLLIQVFMALLAVTILPLAAMVAERRRVAEALGAAHEALGLRHQQQTADLSSAVEELRAEIAGRERAERFARGIVETMREPLLVLDPDLRVRVANRCFYE
jgi:integral membrane sensor domain MASE1